MPLNQKWTIVSSKFRCRGYVVFEQSRGIQMTLNARRASRSIHYPVRFGHFFDSLVLFCSWEHIDCNDLIHRGQLVLISWSYFRDAVSAAMARVPFFPTQCPPQSHRTNQLGSKPCILILSGKRKPLCPVLWIPFARTSLCRPWITPRFLWRWDWLQGMALGISQGR